MPSTITHMPETSAPAAAPPTPPSARPSIVRFDSGIDSVVAIRPPRATNVTTDATVDDARTAPCPRGTQSGDVWCPTCDGLMSECHAIRLRGR